MGIGTLMCVYLDTAYHQPSRSYKWNAGEYIKPMIMEQKSIWSDSTVDLSIIDRGKPMDLSNLSIRDLLLMEKSL
jgi:hypothetical protein